MDITEDFKVSMKVYENICTEMGKKRIFLFITWIITTAIIFGIAYLKEGKISITLSLFDFFVLGIIASGIALLINFGNELKELHYSKLLQHEQQLNEILYFLRDIKNTLAQNDKGK